MKNDLKTIIAFGLMLISLSFNAQVVSDSDISIGDKLTVGELTNGTFKFIKLPKANFIIKKGGLANYKSIEKSTVVISNIEKDKKGNTIVELKRNNGKKFFNAIWTIKADLKQALNSGELKQLIKNK